MHQIPISDLTRQTGYTPLINVQIAVSVCPSTTTNFKYEQHFSYGSSNLVYAVFSRLRMLPCPFSVEARCAYSVIFAHLLQNDCETAQHATYPMSCETLLISLLLQCVS